MRIVTRRLELIAATPATVQAAIEGSAALAAALRARVPATWPPEFLDAPALEFTRAKLADATQAGWWMYYALLRGGGERVLIGGGGYAGPPAGGAVTIG